MMPVSRLLKSCAKPPVSWPTASIFWLCRSASSTTSRCRLFLHQPLVGRGERTHVLPLLGEVG